MTSLIWGCFMSETTYGILKWYSNGYLQMQELLYHYHSFAN